MSDKIYVVNGNDGRPRLNLSSTSEGVAVRNKNEATAYSNPLNKHTIQEYIPAPQWVPVSERPKADRTLFLTVEGGDDAEEGYLCLATNVWRSSNGNELWFTPTHWVYKYDVLPPLPAPPKETE